MNHLLNKSFVNGATLREQNPPLKCCQPFVYQYTLSKGLDLSMLKIWGLQIKGLQSFWPSNFENDSTPGVLEFRLYFKKGFRSFNAENLGSIGQRASKLPTVKVGGHKKKSADRPRPLSNQWARIRVVPGSNHFQSLMAGHFATL